MMSRDEAEEARIDTEMYLKGYRYKLICLGEHENLDPLYAKTQREVRSLREDPPIKDMKFRVELIG